MLLYIINCQNIIKLYFVHSKTCKIWLCHIKAFSILCNMLRIVFSVHPRQKQGKKEHSVTRTMFPTLVTKIIEMLVMSIIMNDPNIDTLKIVLIVFFKVMFDYDQNYVICVHLFQVILRLDNVLHVPFALD